MTRHRSEADLVQRKDAARKRLVADATKSDRSVAKVCGLDHKMVHRLRLELEKAGTIRGYRRSGRGHPYSVPPLNDVKQRDDSSFERVALDGVRPLREGFVRATLTLEYLSTIPPPTLARDELGNWVRHQYNSATVAHSYERSVLDGTRGLAYLIKRFAEYAYPRIAGWHWPLATGDIRDGGVRFQTDDEIELLRSTNGERP